MWRVKWVNQKRFDVFCYNTKKELSIWHLVTIKWYKNQLVLLSVSSVRSHMLLWIIHSFKPAATKHFKVNLHVSNNNCFFKIASTNRTGKLTAHTKAGYTYFYNLLLWTSKRSGRKTGTQDYVKQIDRPSIIWKSDLTIKMICSFFPGSGHIDTDIWMHYLDAN